MTTLKKKKKMIQCRIPHLLLLLEKLYSVGQCRKKQESFISNKFTMVKMHNIPQLLLLLKNCIDVVNATKKKKKDQKKCGRKRQNNYHGKNV